MTRNKLIIGIFLFILIAFVLFAYIMYPLYSDVYIGMDKTKVLNEVYFKSSNGKIEVFVNNKNRRIYRDPSEATKDDYLMNAMVWGINYKSLGGTFYLQSLEFDKEGIVLSQHTYKYHDGL